MSAHHAFLRHVRVLGFVPGLLAAGGVVADELSPQRAEMQRALNEAVMATPFDAGDIRKAEAFAVEAKRANVPPVTQPPTYWQPGWTCASLIAHVQYSYSTYRNCIYHHYYYGRYWR